VVAERDRVSARVCQVAVDLLGDAETTGSVLGIDDHAIQRPALPQLGKPIANDGSARTPDHIAKKENAHARKPFGFSGRASIGLWG